MVGTSAFVPLLVSSGLVCSWALEDNLLPLPPMGYNTWNDLFRNLNESSIRSIAERMKDMGFADLGYKYVVLDDMWMNFERDGSGRLSPDKHRFSQGMPALSKHIHSLGMKFGIYTSRGMETCMGMAGSMGREELDALTFSEWGVDYLKNDACGDPDCDPNRKFRGVGGWTNPRDCRTKAIRKYKTMLKALNATGHRIVHSVCAWHPWYPIVGKDLGHLWRIAGDVRDWSTVYETVRIMEQVARFTGPNGWVDPDMLVGSSPATHKRLSALQARAQFSLWCVFGAPLMLGTSVLRMTGADRETYSNAEAIRVNQDALARPPELIFSNCPPYPKFKMYLTDNGFPDFELDFNGTGDPGNRVDCGQAVKASRCSACPPGQCSADCALQDGVCSRSGLAPEENPLPFSRAHYWLPEIRRCQQAWARRLSGRDVALAVVNFDPREAVEVQLPLPQALLSPAKGDTVAMRDLWALTGPLQMPPPGNVSGVSPDGTTLHLRLPADGGHVLLRLSLLPAATDTSRHASPTLSPQQEVSQLTPVQREALEEVHRARSHMTHSEEALVTAQLAALKVGVPARAVLTPKEGSRALALKAAPAARWVLAVVVGVAMLTVALQGGTLRRLAQWLGLGHARRS